MSTTLPHARRGRVVPVVPSLLAALLLAVPLALAGALAGPTGAPAGAAQRPEVATRAVSFRLSNANTSDLPCVADGKMHTVRGWLVGPRPAVDGRTSPTVDVLVHDNGTGGWFWRMPGHPRFDYAHQLAAQGRTVLVVDRLGYDHSALANGDATCLGAQVSMLHQVVQHLYSGVYRYAPGAAPHPGAVPPHATHVVTHGIGVGGAIAEMEAGEYDDVDGLVLMSWSDGQFSDRAVAEAQRETQDCLTTDFASYGASKKQFRSLQLHSAPAAVQREAAQRRNPVPCGDVDSLTAAVATANGKSSSVTAPVLVLFGSRDALNRPGAASAQAKRFTSSPKVVHRTFRGAGAALPLERQAPEVRRTVLRFVDGLR